ncbi:hypothetical protein [Motilibacter aurantiacus]|nr:hypothetical protein [Motilibacter aurantiacus]
MVGLGAFLLLTALVERDWAALPALALVAALLLPCPRGTTAR